MSVSQGISLESRKSQDGLVEKFINCYITNKILYFPLHLAKIFFLLIHTDGSSVSYNDLFSKTTLADVQKNYSIR